MSYDRAHARLGPSAAERWTSCPASVLLIELLPPDTSEYAEEGTAAHELGEMKASLALGMIDQGEYDWRRAQWAERWVRFSDGFDAMEMHTDDYVDLILERKARHPGSVVFLEKTVQTGVPECWGTADVVIVSMWHVEIIDLKYGQGVRVIAQRNPQLRLYGVGALEMFGDLLGTPETVYCTVFQPRLSSTLTEAIPADELREWRDSLIPVANSSLKPGAPFGPSEEACRWCPASGQCKAQAESIFANDLETEPGFMTPSELADALGQVDHIRQWLKALEEISLRKAYREGVQIPGWKVVRSGGQRGVRDQERAVAAMERAGYSRDDFMNEKVKGIGDLEALLGKVQFQALLMDTGIVTKSTGKESLVPESDPRESINKNSEAASVFGAAEDEEALL